MRHDSFWAKEKDPLREAERRGKNGKEKKKDRAAEPREQKIYVPGFVLHFILFRSKDLEGSLFFYRIKKTLNLTRK